MDLKLRPEIEAVIIVSCCGFLNFSRCASDIDAFYVGRNKVPI